jgi:hypothetical protein
MSGDSEHARKHVHPPSPPVPTIAMKRTEKRRCESDAARFNQSYIAAIAPAAYDAATAIAALVDEKVQTGLLYELNCRIRAAKVHLRRFFKAVHNYHIAIRMRIDEIRRTHDARSVQNTLDAHLQAHGEIGVTMDMLHLTWTSASRRVIQTIHDPFLPDTGRHETACNDFTEFFETLLQRHASIVCNKAVDESFRYKPGVGKSPQNLASQPRCVTL